MQSIILNHLQGCSSISFLPPLSSSPHPKYCAVLFSNLPFVLPYASSLNMLGFCKLVMLIVSGARKKEKRAKIPLL